MVITGKLGNIYENAADTKPRDPLRLHWYEAGKRIWRKQSLAGREIAVKFFDEAPEWKEGDILYADEHIVVVIEIMACDCIVIKPGNMFEMARACYEIGNKHLPLFYEDDALLVPFEMPLFRLLTTQGFELSREERKLKQALKTTVSPHSNDNNSLFGKIMKMSGKISNP